MRVVALMCALMVGSGLSQARAAELGALTLSRTADGLFLSAVVHYQPGPAVEDALLRSVPVYFVAQADVLRERWYWSDKRVASVSRTYRLAYQPLTRRWRVSVSSAAGAGVDPPGFGRPGRSGFAAGAGRGLPPGFAARGRAGVYPPGVRRPGPAGPLQGPGCTRRGFAARGGRGLPPGRSGFARRGSPPGAGPGFARRGSPPGAGRPLRALK